MLKFWTNILIFSIFSIVINEFAEAKNIRIIGGRDAFADQYPFMAAIHVTTSNGRFFCAGTLLNDLYILTAAQCVYGAILFSIQLGSNSLTAPDPYRLTVSTSTYHIHPDYNPLGFENDIAIIQLRMPILFNDYILPAHSIPVDNIPPDWTVSAIGWGQISDTNSKLSEKLQFTTLTSLSNDECKITYGNQIKNGMVCAVGNYNAGTCLGDMGSPLVYFIKNANAQIHGVASFISGNGCESTDPSGYTRVYYYDQWIYNVTGLVPK